VGETLFSFITDSEGISNKNAEGIFISEFSMSDFQTDFSLNPPIGLVAEGDLDGGFYQPRRHVELARYALPDTRLPSVASTEATRLKA